MGYGGTGGDLPGLLPLDKKQPDVKYIFRSGDVDDDYEVEKDPIARGKFASVRLARHRITKQIFAAKYLRRRGRAASLESEARHEIAVLLLGRTDPYIIHLHQVYEARCEYVILLEFGSGGDLQRLLDDQSKFQEKTVRDLLVQVLRGLSFLHERRIAHLDIKPQNLVLMGPTPEDGVKLVDFGLSRVILENVELTQIMGTPDYVAPEVINYEPVGFATDMWSIGVLTYVFLTGCTPFGGNNDQETFVNITQGDYDFPDDLFEDVSILAKDFISSLLLKSTHSRMAVDQSMNHSWMCATTLSEADSADSGYSTEILNGSPPSNLTNGYMSYSIPSLTCQCPIIREESLDPQIQHCDLHSSEQTLNYTKPFQQKTRQKRQGDCNGTVPKLSQEPERRLRPSTGHMSINVMESLHQIPRPQQIRSFGRNSLVIGDQKFSDVREASPNKFGSLKVKKHANKSKAMCSFDEEHSSRMPESGDTCVNNSWSSYSDGSQKRLPEMIFDQDALRNITKPWENLCDGSYCRAINQLQTKGTQKKKSKHNYFGLRPEMSYSMYDLKTVTESSNIYPSDLRLSKCDYKKSKSDLRGSKSDLRKVKSDIRASKSELRASNNELSVRTSVTRSANRDLSRLDESNNMLKSGKRGKSDLRKSRTDLPSLNRDNWPQASHEAIAKLNMSLSRLDLSKDTRHGEESEARDVVYGDFTLPRRFNRSSVSPLLRGNSFHMSFRFPKKKVEKR